MNRRLCVAGVVLSLSVALSGAEAAWAQKSFAPILPLPAGAKRIPLMDEAFRDPVAVKSAINSPNDADRLISDLSGYKRDLQTAQGARRPELIGQIFEAQAVLEIYAADVESGRIPGGGSKVSLVEARRGLAEAAKAYAGSAASDKEKARGQYHVYVMSYLLGNGPAKAVSGLQKLAKDKHLSGPLKLRANLLVSVHNVQGGSREAEATLKTLSSQLPRDSAIVAQLALAKRYASQKKQEYRRYLQAASEKATKLEAKERNEVLAFEVAIWRTAEGNKGGWDKVPIRLAADTQVGRAIAERVALDNWAKNKKPEAIKKMAKLSSDLSGSAMMGKFDERLLQMHAEQYRASHDPVSYEKALMGMKEKYVDKAALGQGNEGAVEKLLADVNERHKSLVYAEIGRAKAPKASSVDRRRAIALAARYSNLVESPQAKEDLNANIAAIYALDQQHENAVKLYLDLAQANASGKTRQYLELAIKSQSVLAKWPASPPWNAVPKGGGDPREKLLDIYKKIGALSKGTVDWVSLSHAGLLQVALGRQDEAFTEWEKALRQVPAGQHAASAAGMMLLVYEKGHRWENLEQLARFCREKQIKALSQGRPVNVDQLFAEALFNGGKSALAESKFDIAIKKLKEFVTVFAQARNRDEGMFYLASAYHGAGQHKNSIQTLISFTEAYPKSLLFRQAMLNGGDWAVPMAFEEDTIYFYEKFLARFANDGEAPRVRGALYRLYMGRALYAEAGKLLRAQAAANNVGEQTKIDSLKSLMRLEERNGTADRAYEVANTLARRCDGDCRAEALGVQARYMNSRASAQDLRRIEGQLATIGDSPVAQDALGEVRFMLAELGAQKAITAFKEVNSISLRDPAEALKQRYGTYESFAKSYERVCDAGITSFCAPALHKLARLSEDMVNSVEDITIVETLPKAQVDAFYKLKQGIISAAVKRAEDADNKAVSIVSKGYTDPNWTGQILWQNSADWDAERVTGETGNGYLQWTAIGHGTR